MRLGSTTEVLDTISAGGNIVEINTVKAIKNSASKLLMKQCFTLAGVKTADWFLVKDGQFLQQMGVDKDPVIVSLDALPYPIVAKHLLGSRGTGNYKLDSQKALEDFLKTKDVKNYIFEKYYNFAREYRLHVTEDGCFYACRKALKKGVPDDKKWQRHDDNCVWYTETIFAEDGTDTKEANPNFQKPTNWDEIVAECVKALEATELDMCSFDIRVQAAETEKGKFREKCDFIIIECNSASSFGENSPNTHVAKKYLEMVPKVATKKAVEYGIIKKK